MSSMAPGSTGRSGAYPLMFDARNSISADAPASPSVNAVDRSRLPPGPLEAGKSQSLSNKRPANSPINPTAEKRPRTIGTSDQSNSAVSVNPAVPRTNSTTRPVGTTTSRPSSVMSPSENVIHPSRDPRKQVRTPASSASPMHVASPLSVSNGDAYQHNSGNSTPNQEAPLAPSMVPSTVPFPLKRPTDNGVKRSVASIRQAAQKKQTLSTPASENAALASIRAKNIELQNELKNEKSERSSLEKRLSQLEKKLQQPQVSQSDPNLMKKVEELSKSVQLLQNSQQEPLTNEVVVRSLVDRVLESVRSDVRGVFDAKFEDSVNKAVQSARPDVSAIQSEVEQRIQSSVDNAITSQNAILNGLTKGPNSLENRLKQSFQPEIKRLKTDVSDLTKELGSFDEEFKKSLITGLSALQGQLKEVETKVDALEKKKGRIDSIENDADSNKNRLEHLEQGLANVTAKLKEIETAKEANVVSNKRHFDDLVTKLNNTDHHMETLNKEDLPKKLVDFKKEFGRQKIENAQRFTKLEEANLAQQKSLEEAAGKLTRQMESEVNKRVTELNTKMERLQQAMADTKQDIADIRQTADQNKKEAQATLAGLGSSISTTASTPRTEFQQKQSVIVQDPEQNPSAADMQILVEEAKSAIMSETRQTQSHLEEEVRQLRFKVLGRSETGAAGSENDELGQIREDAEHARETAEVAQNLVVQLGDKLIGEVQKRIVEQHQAFEEQLSIMKLGLQSMEDRYQNITTDELHQRMVHWFTQNYPTASDLFHKLNALENSVDRIGMFTNTIAWIQDDHNGQLRSLVDYHDAIQHFFDGGEGQRLGDIQKSMADLNQALRSLQADWKAESSSRTLLAGGLSEMQERIGRVEGGVGELDTWKADLKHRWETHQGSTDQMQRMLSTIVIAVYELQHAIKTVNKQLPRGGFKDLKFSEDFSEPLNL